MSTGGVTQEQHQDVLQKLNDLRVDVVKQTSDLRVDVAKLTGALSVTNERLGALVTTLEKQGTNRKWLIGIFGATASSFIGILIALFHL